MPLFLEFCLNNSIQYPDIHHYKHYFLSPTADITTTTTTTTTTTIIIIIIVIILIIMIVTTTISIPLG